MSSKPKAPWGNILGKPIEPGFGARAEQARKMLRIKNEHYGIEGDGGRAWYEMAVALACELDKALTIIEPVPPRTDRTAHRWRSAEGIQFANQIEYMKEDYEAAGKPWTVIALLAEHQQNFSRYRGWDLKKLERKYYLAKAYYDETAEHRPK